MGTYGARCGAHGCVAGPEFSCCQDLGGGKCLGCGVGDFVNPDGSNPSHGLFIYNSHGQFAGCMLYNEGSLGAYGMQPLDIMTDVNSLPPDEDFYADLASYAGKPLAITFARPSTKEILSVVVNAQP